ncbi:PaaI family thioesterase [Agrobacterium sp. T29]|uniref:PaaI family thioesterase n=1 Tax=Agrobacterium sp. T29 TaxID=2580515 RepID=UPI00143DC6DC|nr:PaaI family thioesterase [Agrobacterium sp. T29]
MQKKHVGLTKGQAKFSVSRDCLEALVGEETAVLNQQLLDAGWIHDPSEGLIAYLGGVWIRDNDGAKEFGFVADERHVNRNGVVHGGMLMTFMDRAFGMTARLTSGATRVATISLSHQFMTPMQIGQFATVIPNIAKAGGRTSFVDGTLFQEETPIMHAHGVWRL